MITYLKMPQKKKVKLIVQIPAYNEEAHIGKVIKEIPREIEGIDEVEVLVIDDGSSDNTIEEAKKAGADYIVRNIDNQGLGKTFKNGIDHAIELGADIIVNIDADGQFNSKDISKLIKPILDKEANMVTCSRFLKPEMTRNMPWIKKWGNRRFTKLVNKLTGQKFTDTQCGFRAYSKEAAMRLNVTGSFTYTQEVFLDLAEKGLKIKEIPLEVNYFKDRKSVVSGKLMRYGFKSFGIIARATRDTQPMTFFGLPAMIIFILGFIGGAYSFGYWLFTSTTTPVRTLLWISIFFVTSGIALGILALVADMLKRVNKNLEEILYKLKKKEFGNGH
ncbi:glycosyltransferase family 2 protein [Candidatus Pacearchaeota archaeon]|nr:glycosyltransferase family 2 protein [Candidatus Pacearchaeota archaeon]